MANDDIHKDGGPFWLDPTVRVTLCFYGPEGGFVASPDRVTADYSKVTCTRCLDRGPACYRGRKELNDGD